MWLQGMEAFKLSLEYLPLPHAGFLAHPRRDLLMSSSSVVLWRGLLRSPHLCFARELPPSSYSSYTLLPFRCTVWDACRSCSEVVCVWESPAKAERCKSLAACQRSQTVDEILSSLGLTVSLHVRISWERIGKYFACLKTSKIVFKMLALATQSLITPFPCCSSVSLCFSSYCSFPRA